MKLFRRSQHTNTILKLLRINKTGNLVEKRQTTWPFLRMDIVDEDPPL